MDAPSFLVLVVAVAVVWGVATSSAELSVDSPCDASDYALQSARDMVCVSLVGHTSKWCGTVPANVSAHGDWPNQAVYLMEVLNTLASSSTCLNTSVAKDTVSWLDGALAEPSVGGSFMWTYLVFQVQYYDMPRHAGDRIESPWTLGMKCWGTRIGCCTYHCV